MKPKRNIEGLQPHEVISILTKKEAKKIFKLCNLPVVNVYPCKVSINDSGNFYWTINEHVSICEVKYPATDFIAKKSKKASKKWVLEQIEYALKNVATYKNDAGKITVSLPALNVPDTSDMKVTDDETVGGELEPPKDIDFSVPGQLVSCNHSTLVVMTSGDEELTSFTGFVVYDCDDTRKYNVGEYGNDWAKKYFKPYTGEPIILKP